MPPDLPRPLGPCPVIHIYLSIYLGTEYTIRHELPATSAMLHSASVALCVLTSTIAGAAELEVHLADAALDERVERVARALGQQYLENLNSTTGIIGDMGKGVALGNAAHVVCSNWLIAVSTRRRLLIRSHLLKALFSPPAGLPPELLYHRAGPGQARQLGALLTSSVTTYPQLSQFLSAMKDVLGVQWQFKVVPPRVPPRVLPRVPPLVTTLGCGSGFASLVLTTGAVLSPSVSLLRPTGARAGRQGLALVRSARSRRCHPPGRNERHVPCCRRLPLSVRLTGAHGAAAARRVRGGGARGM